jgi:hypothetical protein
VCVCVQDSAAGAWDEEGRLAGPTKQKKEHTVVPYIYMVFSCPTNI